MFNNLSTQKFAEYYYSKVVADYLDKKYTSDYFIDFKISKDELPHDFNEEEFLQVFKNNFNIIKIEINDYLGYGIHVFGKVKCGNYNAQDFIEAGKYLESLSPNLEEASIALNNFGKQINS